MNIEITRSSLIILVVAVSNCFAFYCGMRHERVLGERRRRGVF